MRHLLLLRHGEAEPASPGYDDKQRRLTPRGRAQVLEAAHCLAATELSIDFLLISPARRAAETARLLVAQLQLKCDPHYDATLYLGPPDALLLALQQCDVQARNVLMIGHNPGISAFAHQMAPSEQPVELRTAGLCRIDFAPDSWLQIRGNAANRFALLR